MSWETCCSSVVFRIETWRLLMSWTCFSLASSSVIERVWETWDVHVNWKQLYILHLDFRSLFMNRCASWIPELMYDHTSHSCKHAYFSRRFISTVVFSNTDLHFSMEIRSRFLNNLLSEFLLPFLTFCVFVPIRVAWIKCKISLIYERVFLDKNGEKVWPKKAWQYCWSFKVLSNRIAFDMRNRKRLVTLGFNRVD